MAMIIDGGVATTLQRAGHDLSGPLWSARLLTENPQALLEVHRAFFLAGADIATTASYQLSRLSLERAGGDPAEEAALIRLSVQLAQQARNEINPAGLIAGSLGPYGASLGDGSEYTGCYHLGTDEETVQALREFHRPRIAALLEAGVDLIAAETIPRVAEIEALSAELVGVPAWVSFTPAPGGRRTRTGVCLEVAAEPLHDLPLAAVGVNCCPPADVGPALAALSVLELPAVAYPNSGEGWDEAAGKWTGRPTYDALDWAQPDLTLAGGCCRVTPEQIHRLAERLRSTAVAAPPEGAAAC